MAIYKEFNSAKRLYVSVNKDTGKLSVYHKDADNDYVSAVEGMFAGIQETEYDGKFGLKKYVVIVLKDKDEEYHVRLSRYTYYTLFLLNKLASLEEAHKILIGAFKTDDGQINVYIKHNGQSLKPKFDADTMRKAKAFGPNKSEDGRNKAIDGLVAACSTIRPAVDFAFTALDSAADDFAPVDDDADSLPF